MVAAEETGCGLGTGDAFRPRYRGGRAAGERPLTTRGPVCCSARFGNTTLIKEQTHEAWGWAPLERFWQDVRYAFRQVRKSPGFTRTAILTLALGVGSVTAVFSVVYAVLLSPYPFHDPGQIVIWRESIREIENLAPLLPDNYRHYLNLKAQAHSIQDAAVLQNPAFTVSTGDDHPHVAEGLAVSSNFFSVLGVPPLLGRSFLPDEEQEGRDREVILTWSGWQRLFHGDPSILDKTLRINGEQRTVIGVLPKAFRFPVMSVMPSEATRGSTERYEIFTPLVPSSLERTANDAEFNFLVVARLKDGVPIRAAQSEDIDGDLGPVISSTVFSAPPPDLPTLALMDMGFAALCQLARECWPRIRFLSISTRLCSTLPSDPASRRRPCASLILHLHQVG
jgi:hypothetical protein